MLRRLADSVVPSIPLLGRLRGNTPEPTYAVEEAYAEHVHGKIAQQQTLHTGEILVQLRTEIFLRLTVALVGCVAQVGSCSIVASVIYIRFRSAEPGGGSATTMSCGNIYITLRKAGGIHNGFVFEIRVAGKVLHWRSSYESSECWLISVRSKELARGDLRADEEHPRSWRHYKQCCLALQYRAFHVAEYTSCSLWILV